MRCKAIATLVYVASLSVFASTAAAQAPTPPPPDQPGTSQQPERRDSMPAMMPPDVMQMMGPMLRVQDGRARGHESQGPLQGLARLMSALDDPRARATLGLTDQEADQLRKIIVDTETFTIRTGADIAVNAIELHELLRADKPDKAAVTAKGDQISRDTSQLVSHYVEAVLAAKTLLSPEQQQAIRSYLAAEGPVVRAPHP
jgi:Spy/CpxP family protein refolding chaperone